jgi:hypothetical protein
MREIRTSSGEGQVSDPNHRKFNSRVAAYIASKLKSYLVAKKIMTGHFR